MHRKNHVLHVVLMRKSYNPLTSPTQHVSGECPSSGIIARLSPQDEPHTEAIRAFVMVCEAAECECERERG